MLSLLLLLVSFIFLLFYIANLIPSIFTNGTTKIIILYNKYRIYLLFLLYYYIIYCKAYFMNLNEVS